MSTGGSAYTNDADGNTLSDGTRTSVWDSQNRLVSCTAGGTVSTYTYGADGLRRSSTVNGVTTYYVYDGSMMVREMKQNAQGVLQPTATYLQGPRGPEYRRDDTQAEGTYTDASGTQYPAGKTRWYVYDGLGSVVGEVDPSGNLTSSGTFDVYGAKRQGGTGAATSRQGFVGSLGHVTDSETGLVYMRARYYDPGTGRFVSQDIAKSGNNWFVYASDNPVNRVDADGRVDSSVIDALDFFLRNLGGTAAFATANFLKNASLQEVITWMFTTANELLTTSNGQRATAGELEGMALDAKSEGLDDWSASLETAAKTSMEQSVLNGAASLNLRETAWLWYLGSEM